MARNVPLVVALTRPITARAITPLPRDCASSHLVIAFDIPSTVYTIEMYARDVCIIKEDRGNGAIARTVTDYSSFPIPTGISYAVSAVDGENGPITPPFILRLNHDGVVSAQNSLPSLTGLYR